MKELNVNEKIMGIIRKVMEINKTGGDLILTLTNSTLDLRDGGNDCKSIIPHETHRIYFDDFWGYEFEKMVDGTMGSLKNYEKECEDKDNLEIEKGDYVLYKDKICLVTHIENGKAKIVYQIFDSMYNIISEEEFVISDLKKIKLLPF